MALARGKATNDTCPWQYLPTDHMISKFVFVITKRRKIDKDSFRITDLINFTKGSVKENGLRSGVFSENPIMELPPLAQKNVYDKNDGVAASEFVPGECYQH